MRYSKSDSEPTDSLKIIGQNICEIRKEKNLTQKTLAKQIGMKSASYICRLERGQLNVTIKTLEKLADALSVELDDLLPLSIPTKAVAKYIAYLIERKLEVPWISKEGDKVGVVKEGDHPEMIIRSKVFYRDLNDYKTRER